MWAAVDIGVRSISLLPYRRSQMRRRSRLLIRSMFTIIDPGSSIVLPRSTSTIMTIATASTISITMFIPTSTPRTISSSTIIISSASSAIHRGLCFKYSPWAMLCLSLCLDQSQNPLDICLLPDSALRLQRLIQRVYLVEPFACFRRRHTELSTHIFQDHHGQFWV